MKLLSKSVKLGKNIFRNIFCRFLLPRLLFIRQFTLNFFIGTEFLLDFFVLFLCYHFFQISFISSENGKHPFRCVFFPLRINIILFRPFLLFLFSFPAFLPLRLHSICNFFWTVEHRTLHMKKTFTVPALLKINGAADRIKLSRTTYASVNHDQNFN